MFAASAAVPVMYAFVPEKIPPARGPPRDVRARHEEVVVVALENHIAPDARRGGREDPRLERHRIRQPQRRRIGDRHAGRSAVEDERASVLPLRRPSRGADRASVAPSRRVADSRPGALVERVGRDEPTRKTRCPAGRLRQREDKRADEKPQHP